MNMLTEVRFVADIGKGIEANINNAIKDAMKDGWYLRGTPAVLDENHVLLTFEKPETEEKQSIRSKFIG